MEIGTVKDGTVSATTTLPATSIHCPLCGLVFERADWFDQIHAVGCAQKELTRLNDLLSRRIASIKDAE